MADVDEYQRARQTAVQKALGDEEEDPAFAKLAADIGQRRKKRDREEALSGAASKIAKGAKAAGLAASVTPWDLGIGDYLYAGGELIDPEGDPETAAATAAAGLATGGVASGALIARSLAAKKALAARRAKKKAEYEKNIQDPEWFEQFLVGGKRKPIEKDGVVDWDELKKRLDEYNVAKKRDQKRVVDAFLRKSVEQSLGGPEGGLPKYVSDYAQLDPDFKSYLREMGIIVDPKENDLPGEE